MLGNFSGLSLIGISRNCLEDIQVTEAPLSNSQSEVPLFEVTLIKGLVPTVFQRELHASVQIAKILLKNVLVGGTTEIADTELRCLPTCMLEGPLISDMSEPFTENLGGMGSNNLPDWVVASCTLP